MKIRVTLVLMAVILASCGKSPTVDVTNQILKSNGHWIKEQNGQIMLDPQPSALVSWRGKLLTLSDRSADPSQRLRLRAIEPNSAVLNGPNLVMKLSDEAKMSCFANYVSDNPDLEALAVDPDDDSIFYMVSEDASNAAKMSADCQTKFQDSGATQYPRLLIRLILASETQVLITHIKPLKFSADMQVGNFPNDGVEALTFGKNRRLYLGVEKDTFKKARVFSLKINEQLWNNDDFAQVLDVQVNLPKFKAGNHPINGMDYYQTAGGLEYLIMAARNDQDLWVVDLSGLKPTKIVPLKFHAEIINGNGVCQGFEEMDNTSIEGLAIIEDTVWMVNDPWKAVYLNNIRCPQNKRHYQKFAPLLFSLPIQKSWFE